MNFRHLRWAPFSAAFLLFALVDLLLLFALPWPEGVPRPIVLMLVPPLLSGIVVLMTLPSFLTLFERQQEHIERQKRQIVGLHAMDTAIASEQELGAVLSVAAREATRAVDADQGGVLLLPGEPGEAETEAFYNVNEDDAARAAFRDLLRRGSSGGGGEDSDNGNNEGQVARVPVERGGQLLGYLVVARSGLGRPPFGQDDFAVLKDLAGTIVVGVKNAQALSRARQSAAAAHVAGVLQEALLPPVPEQAGAYLFSKRYVAQSNEAAVGGDVYDLFRLDEDRWGVMIADVSGKGLEAARKTALVKYSLRAFAREHTSPAHVVTRLNDVLCDEETLTGFVTLVYGVLDAHGGFTYASAGHETPLLCRHADTDGPQASVEPLPPTGLVLGAVNGEAYGENSVTLHPGDSVFLYTDGLSEARPPGADTSAFLEVEGLSRIVQGCLGGLPEQIVSGIFEQVQNYAGGRLADDVAMLWIQRAR